MNNFIYHNPTELVFGKGQIARLAKLIPADKRIMITFGGGSVKRNGVYEQVIRALEGREVVEFWGIEANPSVETLRRAIALGKERKVDFLLAVGGGSVIDGTKLIAAGLLYDGDAWEIVLRGRAEKSVPLATVLTISATGSEDFALVAERVPSAMMYLGAGYMDERGQYTAHNPKVVFNEGVLPIGAACMAHCAVEWLKENT